MRRFVAIAFASSLAACGLSLSASQTESNDAGASLDSGSPAPRSDAGIRDAAVSDVPMKPDINLDPGPPRCDVVPTEERIIDALQGTVSPTIDGKADDWAGAIWHRLKHKAILNETAPCADFAIRWDADGVYLYVRVADLTHAAPAKDSFRNDSVEVFLGPTPVALTGKYGENERHYSIDFTGAAAMRRIDNRSDAFVVSPILSGTELYFAVNTTLSWGYGVEIRIPPMRVATGTMSSYAFDVAAVDGQGADLPQQGYMLWAPLVATSCNGELASPRHCCDIGSRPYCNTKHWGILNLK
jgi:hypothetical protein